MRRNVGPAVTLAMLVAASLSGHDARAQLQPPPQKVIPAVLPPSWTACTTSAEKGLAAAVGLWTQTAVLTNVRIDGPNASGGEVSAPPLRPQILQQMLADKVATDVANAFASSLDSAWSAWAASVKIPGLALYPTFAAFPGPVAPPTPNLPVPLLSLVNVPVTMGEASLNANLSRALGTHMKEAGASSAVGDFTKRVAQHFTTFTATCTVTNVLGSGPVPTFAPPYVPAGSVVGGQGTMTPGGFRCIWQP